MEGEILLLTNETFQKGKRIHGDKAFFAEENIHESEQKGIKTNFVPKDNIKHGMTLKRAIIVNNFNFRNF